MKKIIKEIQREIIAATERKEWQEVKRLADLARQAENKQPVTDWSNTPHPAADKNPFVLTPMPTVTFDNHRRDDVPF